MTTLINTPVAGKDQGLSTLLARACLALAVVLPLAAIAGVCQTAPAGMLGQMGIRLPSGYDLNALRITGWQHGLAMAISLLPVSAVAYALWRAYQCFSGFAQGDVFHLATVRHLRGFAAGLLAASGAGVVVPTLVVLLLTWGAPAGQRVLTLSVGSQQLLMLLFSGIVWQMGHTMARAVALAEDNAQII